MFFQCMMGFNEDKRSGSLKTDTPLDANNGIPHVYIPSDTIRLCYVLQLLNNLNRTYLFTIQCYGSAINAVDSYRLRFVRGHLSRQHSDRQIDIRVQCIRSDNGGPPQAFVNVVYGFFGIDLYAVLCDISYFFLSG